MSTDEPAKRRPGRPKKDGGSDPVRSFRSPDSRWNAAEGTLPPGRTMTDLVNDLLGWYLRVPGVKPPKRPVPPIVESED